MKKNNSAARINEELEEEIINTKLQLSEKNQLNTELNNLVRALETKMQKIEAENGKLKEDLEELQQDNEDEKTRTENMNYKETMKTMQENFNILVSSCTLKIR